MTAPRCNGAKTEQHNDATTRRQRKDAMTQRWHNDATMQPRHVAGLAHAPRRRTKGCRTWKGRPGSGRPTSFRDSRPRSAADPCVLPRHHDEAATGATGNVDENATRMDDRRDGWRDDADDGRCGRRAMRTTADGEDNAMQPATWTTTRRARTTGVGVDEADDSAMWTMWMTCDEDARIWHPRQP
ncbi:hypothetical protein BJ912DRAFT_920513 [Pholiota molesta]|nr:hypothetical protein BJ912DRAFT_920513 [Pholiota molesta]